MAIPLNYFVSYARDDRLQVDRFLSLLAPRLGIAADFEFNEWTDHRIVVGNQWRAEIEAALAACDFGLLLLSPGFFASRFIVKDELPHFIQPGPNGPAFHKPIVPVGLKAVPLDGSADLKGVGQTQIFRDKEGRWFDQTRGHVSDRWVDQLVAAMVTKFTKARMGGP